jgi:hypothetical protein
MFFETSLPAAPRDEGYCIDSIDPLLLRSDAKRRVSKHEGINTRVFQQPVNPFGARKS